MVFSTKGGGDTTIILTFQIKIIELKEVQRFAQENTTMELTLGSSDSREWSLVVYSEVSQYIHIYQMTKFLIADYVLECSLIGA